MLKAGTIAFNGSGIDCVVRNISADGAALEVESQVGIPSEFDLVISTERSREFCRVLWRTAKRLGVVFQPGDSTGCAPPLAPVLPSRCESPYAHARGRSEDTLLECPAPSIDP
jgi:hypothetical protein